MYKVLVFILLFKTSINLAQDDNEFEQKQWVGYSLNLNLPKKITLSFAIEQRFEDGLSEIDKNFLQSELSYQSNKYFEVGGLYRATWESEEERMLNRYSVFFNLKYKKGRFKLSNRNLLQASVRSYNGESSIRYRNKTKVKYKLTKNFKPYISYEMFYRFDERNMISNNRVTLGSVYTFNKNWDVKLFYLLEQEIKSDHNKIEGVFGIKLIGNLKVKKKV
jgi:hypothetical protein